MATEPQAIIDAATPAVDAAAPAPTAPVAEQVAAPEAQPDAADFYREGEQPAEGTEGQAEGEVEAEPIAPPNSWSKEDQAQFAALPREAQEIVARRETERDKFVQTKSREAAQTRQAVEAEARQALLTIQRNHATQLAKYAEQFQAPEPDARLLQTGDPEHMRLYLQQEAAYRGNTAQRSQAQQEADQARQQAEALEQHEHQLAMQAEVQVLQEKIPEWSDPSARAKLLSDLEPIAAELGYSPEVMAQARAADIIALRHVSELKAKASKYDQLMKTKMAPVRAAKTLPPIARAAAPAGQSQPVSVAATLYPNDVRRN